MNCGQIKLQLASVDQGDARSSELEAHLEACASCRRADATLGQALLSLDMLSRSRPKVDVVARVMQAVGELEPVRRRGMGRAARWLIAASVLGLLAQGTWTGYSLASGAAPGNAPGMFGAGWDLLTRLAGLGRRLAILVFEVVSGSIEILGGVLEALAPFLPLWYVAVVSGFLLLFAAAVGIVRLQPRQLAGELT